MLPQMGERDHQFTAATDYVAGTRPRNLMRNDAVPSKLEGTLLISDMVPRATYDVQQDPGYGSDVNEGGSGPSRNTPHSIK